MPGTPRDPATGKFLCVPPYPRKRTSRCGCGGGGVHPCPIAERFVRVRQAARREYSPPRWTPADIEEAERELYGLEAEREALIDPLDYVRTQIRALGSLSNRTHARHGAYGQSTHLDSYGEESELGYRELLEERQKLRAHETHLTREIRSLRSQLKAQHRRLAPSMRLGLARRRWSATTARPRWFRQHVAHYRGALR